jgi:UDP-3-O-[3-hydroxymyristoyl] glucosamine N-acyltransferase
MSRPATAGELAAVTGAELRGEANEAVTGAATLAAAGEGDLAFVAQPAYREALSQTRATAVIAPPSLADHGPGTVLVHDNPYWAWARALQRLYPEEAEQTGIHHTAVVGEGARISPEARLDAHVVVGAGARIADGVWLEAGTVVGEDADIGRDCRIGPNATLYASSRLGERVRVHAGAVLGSDGFGYAADSQGRHAKIPQLGWLEVGDDVEIGANAAIDRGALEATVIGTGTKIDNQVHIAHNCRLGEHCVVAGQSGFAGSAELGDRCILGAQVGIAGHLRVAPGTMLAARAGVIGDIDTPGTYAGFPHQPHGEWRRMQASLRQLPDMRRRLSRLERGSHGSPTEEGES